MTYALYRHFDNEGRLLYVGISSDIARRNKLHTKNSVWFSLVSTIQIENFASRADAAKAEIQAIREEGPIYNIAFTNKDDRVRKSKEALSGSGSHGNLHKLGVVYPSKMAKRWVQRAEGHTM